MDERMEYEGLGSFNLIVFYCIDVMGLIDNIVLPNYSQIFHCIRYFQYVTTSIQIHKVSNSFNASDILILCSSSFHLSPTADTLTSLVSSLFTVN